MSTTEQQRHDLHKWLEEAMGEERAAVMMGYFPPVGWADVATKADLEHLRTATKADLEHLRTATKADLEHLRTATKADLEHLRTATKADLEHLRTATKADLDATEHRILAELHHRIAEQTRTILVVMVSALVGLIVASAATITAAVLA